MAATAAQRTIARPRKNSSSSCQGRGRGDTIFCWCYQGSGGMGEGKGRTKSWGEGGIQDNFTLSLLIEAISSSEEKRKKRIGRKVKTLLSLFLGLGRRRRRRESIKSDYYSGFPSFIDGNPTGQLLIGWIRIWKRVSLDNERSFDFIFWSQEKSKSKIPFNTRRRSSVVIGHFSSDLIVNRGPLVILVEEEDTRNVGTPKERTRIQIKNFFDKKQSYLVFPNWKLQK